MPFFFQEAFSLLVLHSSFCVAFCVSWLQSLFSSPSLCYIGLSLTHAFVDQKLLWKLSGFIHKVKGSPSLVLPVYILSLSKLQGESSLSWLLWPKGWHNFCQHFISGRVWLPDWHLLMEHDLKKKKKKFFLTLLHSPPAFVSVFKLLGICFYILQSW